MTNSKIEIQTKDGACPSYVYRPSGSASLPAVLVYMDGIGIRPAMLEIGEKLATHGFFVLVPDLFYRSGPYEPMDATVFSDPRSVRSSWGSSSRSRRRRTSWRIRRRSSTTWRRSPT